MINTQAYFENIQAVIKQELALCNKSVYIAVAWFTDKTLFNEIINSLARGVSVFVCLENDDINFGARALPWNQFKEAGGQLFPKEEMHHKFCVIDGAEVITGSYNWTYKAASINDENIILTSGDYALATNFISEFKRITGLTDEQPISYDLGKILKRLAIIKDLMELEEKEDIAKQAFRLQTETGDSEIQSIVHLLLTGSYADAVRAIENFLKHQSQITAYTDPVIAAIRMEIKMLEYEIIALENEQTEYEKIGQHFEIVMNRIVGEVLIAVLRLRKERAYQHRQESQYSQSEYEEAKRQYEEQTRQRVAIEEEEKRFYNLSIEEQLSLKQAYRQAALLCHPDKVAEKDKKDAEALFTKLHDAYLRQDAFTVHQLFEQLKQGWFMVEANSLSSLELLAKKKQELITNRNKVISGIQSLKSTDAFKMHVEGIDLEAHFFTIKKELEEELLILKSEYGATV